MPPEPTNFTESHVVLDASVLFNFIAVDRAGALVGLRGHRFVITDHVRAEISGRYSTQLGRLNAIIRRAAMDIVAITDTAELLTFAQLTEQGLGVGECASIALAHHRGWHRAVDDKVARKRAMRLDAAIVLDGTQSITVSLIRSGAITVEDADAMLEAWRTEHRFRLAIGSFAELLAEP